MRRKLTERTTVDPRVSFDVTTPGLNVTARTTDPMVFGEGGGSKAERLADALGVVQQGMPLISQAMQVGTERNYQEGAMGALTGEDRPTKGMIKIKGWDTLKGELTARREYREELNTFFNENHLEMLPEEFEAGVQEISQKYIQGASRGFLDGFLQNAISTEQDIFDKYNNTQRELARQASVELISDIAYTTAHDTLNAYITSNFEGVETLEDIRKRPDILWAISKDDTLGTTLGGILRADLTNAQERGKELGLTRHEVNSLYLEQVGEVAGRYGLPELLDFLYITDADGIAPLTKDLRGYQYLSKSEGTQDSTVNEYLKAVAKADEDDKKQAEKELQERLTNLSKSLRTEVTFIQKTAEVNPVVASEDAMELLEFMFSEESEFYRLDESKYTALLRDTLDLATMDTGFIATSESFALETLNELVDSESLNHEALITHRPFLSWKDWEKYTGLLTSQEKSLWNQKVANHKTTIANRVLDIRNTEDVSNRQYMALQYLRALEEDSLFWELGAEATTKVREDLFEMAMSDTVFANKDSGEVVKRLDEAKRNRTLSQQDIMDSAHLLTQATWRGFWNSLIDQDEYFRKVEEDRVEANLEETNRQSKEAQDSRVTYYNDTLGDSRLMGTLEARQTLSNLLEEFDSDGIVALVAESTRSGIRNKIIDGLVDNRVYATEGSADHLLYAKLLEDIPEGKVSYALIDEYVEQGLLTKGQHLDLLNRQQAKMKADADALAEQEEQERIKAEKERIQGEEDAQKAEDERKEKAKNSFLKNLNTQVTDLVNLRGVDKTRRARELKELLRQGDGEHDIPVSTYNDIYGTLSKLEGKSDQFAEASDRTLITELDYQAVYGALTFEEITSYANQGLLNQSDFLRYSREISSQEEELDREQQESDKKTAQYIASRTKELITLAIGADPSNMLIDGVQQSQAASLTLGFLEASWEFQKQHGRGPTDVEFDGKIAPAVLLEHGFNMRDLDTPQSTYRNEFGTTEPPITATLKLEEQTLEQVTREGFLGTRLGRRTETTQDPEYSISRMDGHRMFDTYASQGYTLSEILTAVNADILESGGSPLTNPQAQKYYIQNYADITVANTYLENYDPITYQPEKFATALVREQLQELGYSELEIAQAIYMGREYFDMEIAKMLNSSRGE